MKTSNSFQLELFKRHQEVKTRVDVIVKDSKVILPEDQHNTNSHSLLLDVSLVNSTIYSSNFAELKD
jgi:hypothetical protein